MPSATFCNIMFTIVHEEDSIWCDLSPPLVHERHFLVFLDSFVGKKSKKVRMTAPSYFFSMIWKERKKITFDNEEILMHTMKKHNFLNLGIGCL